MGDSRSQIRAGLREGEVRFLTDDMDIERTELAIFPGGNGDWYIGVVEEGTAGTVLASGRFVRVRTSGVAVHGMPRLVAELYRLLRRELAEAARG